MIIFCRRDISLYTVLRHYIFIQTVHQKIMNEVYVMLNVDYKSQKNIIEKIKKIPTTKSVKTVYGIYDILVILESDDMQKIKNAIDVDLHNIDGINNMTSLIAIN